MSPDETQLNDSTAPHEALQRLAYYEQFGATLQAHMDEVVAVAAATKLSAEREHAELVADTSRLRRESQSLADENRVVRSESGSLRDERDRLTNEIGALSRQIEQERSRAEIELAQLQQETNTARQTMERQRAEAAVVAQEVEREQARLGDLVVQLRREVDALTIERDVQRAAAATAVAETERLQVLHSAELSRLRRDAQAIEDENDRRRTEGVAIVQRAQEDADHILAEVQRNTDQIVSQAMANLSSLRAQATRADDSPRVELLTFPTRPLPEVAAEPDPEATSESAGTADGTPASVEPFGAAEGEEVAAVSEPTLSAATSAVAFGNAAEDAAAVVRPSLLTRVSSPGFGENLETEPVPSAPVAEPPQSTWIDVPREPAAEWVPVHAPLAMEPPTLVAPPTLLDSPPDPAPPLLTPLFAAPTVSSSSTQQADDDSVDIEAIVTRLILRPPLRSDRVGGFRRALGDLPGVLHIEPEAAAEPSGPLLVTHAFDTSLLGSLLAIPGLDFRLVARGENFLEIEVLETTMLPR